ncbi:PKD domain-containing protein [Flavihumibacter profundi]|uniref:PKD domain-containing protein n=1 Tax=Flavihumibacter profundi TaxID=2716883 RepID=UPI001CC7B8AF|nr:PKD domain-containing protein [Flavihumibacter profundi]MBZ5857133.1 gliding motility-associated C-terminal domain-containing protein [Flavihumibacter profundi]
MKTCGLLLLAFLAAITTANAAHIRGGEITYKYLGPGSDAGTSKYELTLKLYVDCRANNPGQLDESINFTIFDKATGGYVSPAVFAPFTSERYIQYDPNSNPCILNPPRDICYRLRFYQATVTLKNSAQGYTVAFQRCCRIADIINVAGNSGNTGATYSCEIPGTDVLGNAPMNSSPIFNPNDAIAICAGSAFTFDFSATDPDGTDVMVYALCDAYKGGGTTPGECTNCTSPSPTSNPPFEKISYRQGYSGASPLGPNVKIDAKTGLLSGFAPRVVGQYVVTACVSEYRQGKLINTHRKDIHISVSDCQPLKAVLDPDYHFCDDFNVTLQNGQVNPSGSTYIWNYGDGTKPDTVKTALGQVQHQYADTGTYTVSLFISLANGQCIDQTTTLAKVYPGFFPGFLKTGSCLLTPFNFIDTTKTRYGKVDKWTWDFGDETTDADVSSLQRPSYKYNSLGIKAVTLTVGNSFGCLKTVSEEVEVRDKPSLVLPFRDTLICSIDTLQLNATGPGTLNPQYNWTPLYNIITPNSPNPLVYPKTNTYYTVRLSDNGCTAVDSVHVRVVDQVTLGVSNDSTICLTDPVQLHASGDGLKFSWTPAATLNDASLPNPIATPTATTTYTVIASIGKCNKSASIDIKTVPYPLALAGDDVVICYDDTVALHATISGSAFSWSPASTLIGANTTDPLAHPLRSTKYTLTVTDNIGCPKPGIDTVTVFVKPLVKAFAGNDTAIVIGQPLQLQATGGEIYNWSPGTGLNFTNISNPVATLSKNQTYSVRVSTIEDCFAFDTINITVFTTNPDIFVPNAFTPGGATNNIFRPKPVGISNLDYFRVYNRYGQMVYSTSEVGRGWDGRISGVMQGTGTYVWMVQGKDFTGKTITKKGTMVLIR